MHFYCNLVEIVLEMILFLDKINHTSVCDTFCPKIKEDWPNYTKVDLKSRLTLKLSDSIFVFVYFVDFVDSRVVHLI